MRRIGKLMRMCLIGVLGGSILCAAWAYRDDLVLVHTIAAARLVEPDCRTFSLEKLEDGWELVSCANDPPPTAPFSPLAEETLALEEAGFLTAN
jgi:hypothetical protein